MSRYLYDEPAPQGPQCEAGGVRNGPDGPGGTEHYWTCTAPGAVDVDGALLCEDHAGELGHGPKQEEYGFDPDGGDLKTAARLPVSDEAPPVAAVLPPGCELPGCKHHYAPGRNLAAEGCICPAWFDGGGWHLIEQNPACTAHRMEG